MAPLWEAQSALIGQRLDARAGTRQPHCVSKSALLEFLQLVGAMAEGIDCIALTSQPSWSPNSSFEEIISEYVFCAFLCP